MVLLRKELTSNTFNCIITPVFLLMVLFVGGINLFFGNLFYCFVGVFWTYLIALFYNRFWIYPDPSIDCHSVCNFVACDAVFGKNNQLYMMHVNSFVKSFIMQLFIFIPAFTDYFLYSFRGQISILYQIDIDFNRKPEIEFLATSLLILAVVLVYSVRDILRVLLVSRRLGKSVRCKNIVFCISSFVCAVATFFMYVTINKLLSYACFALWVISYIAALYFVHREGKDLKRDVEWDKPTDIYFKIFTSNSVCECVASESLAVLENGDIVLLKNGTTDVKYRESSDVDKIVFQRYGATTEYRFDTSTKSWV